MSIKKLAVAVGLMLLIAAPAWATSIPSDPIDPSVLQIGTGFGTACATGCAGDPNVITPTLFDVYYNGGGPALSSPFVVILGLAWDGSSVKPTAPSLTGTYYAGNAGSGVGVTVA